MGSSYVWRANFEEGEKEKGPVRRAQAATGRVPAALLGGKSLQSFLRGVTCPLESQPMRRLASPGKTR
jgi:hypothetical protein